MEWFVVPFIFFGVIAVTALLFGGWVVISLIRLVFRGIVALASPPPLPPSVNGLNGARAHAGVRCANAKCRHLNPAVAQFCRRCGGALPASERVAVRRVAMW